MVSPSGVVRPEPPPPTDLFCLMETTSNVRGWVGVVAVGAVLCAKASGTIANSVSSVSLDLRVALVSFTRQIVQCMHAGRSAGKVGFTVKCHSMDSRAATLLKTPYFGSVEPTNNDA